MAMTLTLTPSSAPGPALKASTVAISAPGLEPVCIVMSSATGPSMTPSQTFGSPWAATGAAARAEPTSAAEANRATLRLVVEWIMSFLLAPC